MTRFLFNHDLRRPINVRRHVLHLLWVRLSRLANATYRQTLQSGNVAPRSGCVQASASQSPGSLAWPCRAPAAPSNLIFSVSSILQLPETSRFLHRGLHVARYESAATTPTPRHLHHNSHSYCVHLAIWISRWPLGDSRRLDAIRVLNESKGS